MNIEIRAMIQNAGLSLIVANIKLIEPANGVVSKTPVTVFLGK
jgi:hypothetical protein